MGVVAVTLTANDVIYSPSNSEFSVTNTKQALDKLYELVDEKSSASVLTPLFSVTENKVAEYEKDITTELNNLGLDYTKLTSANFVLNITSAYGKVQSLGGYHSANIKPEISYDSTTGIIFLSMLRKNNHATSEESPNGTLGVAVYASDFNVYLVK